LKGGKPTVVAITIIDRASSPAFHRSPMAYSPVQLGLRFCENASGPSTASFDLNSRA
jgi:hypothetical protein